MVYYQSNPYSPAGLPAIPPSAPAPDAQRTILAALDCSNVGLEYTHQTARSLTSWLAGV